MSDSPSEKNETKKLSRCEFIIGATAVAATCASLSPLAMATDEESAADFFQKHYKKLTPQDKEKIFQRLEAQIEKRHGVKASISDPPPLDGVEFAYVLSLGRCIGCRKCVYACMKENNTSRDPQIQYIRVLKMNRGALNLESSDHAYPKEEAGDRNQ